MLLLPSRGGGLLPGAGDGAFRLAGLLCFCLALAPVTASAPVDNCPDHIDCARMGRQFCTPGSSQCGPCLDRLEEDEKGNCVILEKHHSRHGQKTSLPDEDEEIDYLSSVIAKQQDAKKPASPSWSNLQFQSEDRNDRSQLKSMSTTVKPTTRIPSTSKSPEPRTDSSGHRRPVAVPFLGDSLLVLLMSVSIIMGIVALVLAAVCWVRLQRESHLAQKVDYPAFQAAGPVSSSKISSGDKNLAHSAQMYHYQHQKQQMLSMDKNKTEPKVSESGATSDEETEEGDFTVYECPGLAPTGEMEVKNPLFDDDRERNHK